MRKIFLIGMMALLFTGLCYGQQWRGWHPGTEQMAFVDEVKGWAPDRLITIGANEDIPEASLELMQTTGLPSIDETVIFQGDILLAPDGYLYIVEHDGVTFRIRKAGTTNYRTFEALRQNADKCEIVGDMWQNPGIDRTQAVFEMLYRARDLWEEFNVEEKALIVEGIGHIEEALTAYNERQGEPD